MFLKYSLVFSFISLFFNLTAQKITYDFSCMEVDEASSMINAAAVAEQAMVRSFGATVTLYEEAKLGNQLLLDLKKEYPVYEYGDRQARMKRIMNNLVSKLSNPRGFSYRIFIMDMDELNAFTCGGKIFVTRKLYHFCLNDSELAAIIGHEIAHNELKHINDNISRNKTANSFGSAGAMTALIGNILTTPFNQRNEVHCDFYGIDLMKKSGYTICSAPAVWKRMSENESQGSQLDGFFSTHPYSSTRRTCCNHHIESNYKNPCN